MALILRLLCRFGWHNDDYFDGWSVGGHPNVWLVCRRCGDTRTRRPKPGMTGKNNGPVLIAPYYGSGSGQTCSSAEEPLPTVTAKHRFAMVVPITHTDGSNRAREVDDSLPTLTTANRGELAMITGCGGRAGQSPVRSVAAPVGTITTKNDRVLVEPGQGVDILFRMLEPHELAAAMGFNDGDRDYEFAGNKTEIVRQIGNAVPCNTAAALVGAMCADMAVTETEAA